MSESTTIDGPAKLRVKEALLEQARAAVAALAGRATEVQAAARSHEDDTYQSDDLSQSDEAGDLTALFEQSEARRQEALDQVERLDFTPSDVVGPGALVGFGGSRFVVGVVADEFECDGATYEGISTESPIYERIEGLRLGDEFEFNGRRDRIDFLA